MKKLGELLVENLLISKEDLEKALAEQKNLENKKPIGEILVDMNLITIDILIQYLELQLRKRVGEKED